MIITSIPNYRQLLNDFLMQKKSIQVQLSCGMINEVDAATEIEMINAKERKLIRKLVSEAHVTETGAPRKITYQGSKGLYYTIMADKKKIYASKEDDLYYKLFVHYGLSITDYSFAGIFDAAIKEKAKTRNRNPGTIKHNMSEYKRYISDDFAKKDIRKITKFDLREYCQNLVNKKSLSEKNFKAFKGLLNLVFAYATEHEIIVNNPVSYINNKDYYISCTPANKNPESKILSEDEIKTVQDTVYRYMTAKRYKGYFINGYAILFSIETGIRAGEIPSLRWDDIKEDYIHIHSQQLSFDNTPENLEFVKTKGYPFSVTKATIYYHVPWTKGEKGISIGGRKFPLTNKIKAILGELKALQTALGIVSDYVFCNMNGEWIKTDAYETCLRRMLKSLDLNVTNNHAFRMSLNSNIFIGKLNLPVTERARLLGHSVETNEKYYSFAGKNNMKDICSMLDTLNEENPEVSPRSHLKVVSF